MKSLESAKRTLRQIVKRERRENEQESVELGMGVGKPRELMFENFLELESLVRTLEGFITAEGTIDQLRVRHMLNDIHLQAAWIQEYADSVAEDDVDPAEEFAR